MRDTAFRVISRLAEEASTPEYQALTTVRSSPKAMMAMAMLRRVRKVLSFLRKAFLNRSLRMNIVQEPLIQVPGDPRLLGCPRVMGDQDDGLGRLPIQPLHQVQD